MEEKTRVLRLNSGIFKQLSEMGNLSEAVTKLIANYKTVNVHIFQDEQYNFWIEVKGIKTLYEVTGVTRAYRVPEGVYAKLMHERYLPDESISNVLFRLLKAYQKPFVLKVCPAHKEIINEGHKYSFSGGNYDLFNIVNCVEATGFESQLICRETNEIIRIFNKPFAKNYTYDNVNKMFCVDQMAYEIYLFCTEYESKSSKQYMIPNSLKGKIKI